MMFGSFLIYDMKGISHHHREICQTSNEGRPHEYSQNTLWQTSFSILAHSAYEGYPSFFLENKDFSIHLEGSIYNIDKSQLITHLNRLGEIVFGTAGRIGTDLQEWLLDTDGDFLVVVLNKHNGNIAVLNDVFGRLPTYYSIDDGCLIVSRDFGLAVKLSKSSGFDRMSIAQYLLLGFQLGKRTWFENVNRLKPATLLKTSAERSSIDVVRIHEFNFESDENPSRSVEENAYNLSLLFREACRKRSQSGTKNIVSLSGGLDSRAVAAGLWRERIPFATASFLDSQRANANDFQTAKQVAVSLGAQWYGCHIPPPQGKNILELLGIKSGLNNLRMSFILPFFQNIVSEFGSNIIYFTGDGGGDVLGDSTPYRKTNSLGCMVDYLIDRYQVFSMDDVAALTGVDRCDIRSAVAEYTDSYPEQSFDRKYQHFFCLEAAINMYNEGEDRNRHYFWSVSPFYSLEFFIHAMNCPNSIKKRYKLYNDFISSINKKVCNIEYANWNASVNSRKFKIYYGIKNITRSMPGIVRSIRKVTGQYEQLKFDSNILRCIKEQVEKCDGLSDYLYPQVVHKILKNASSYDKIQLWTLFTLTSVMESHYGSRTISSNFMEHEFV